MSEFSRVVRLDQIGFKPLRLQIDATPEERDSLSRRFDLLSLDRLTATVDLSRKSGSTIRLEASFEACFAQSCVVTLDPVLGTISDRFSLVYGPEGEEQKEIVLGADEAAFEPLVGDTIDVGEAVAQELSLALPLSPRHPDASIEIEGAETASETLFASLARLRSPKDT